MLRSWTTRGFNKDDRIVLFRRLVSDRGPSRLLRGAIAVALAGLIVSTAAVPALAVDAPVPDVDQTQEPTPPADDPGTPPGEAPAAPEEANDTLPEPTAPPTEDQPVGPAQPIEPAPDLPAEAPAPGDAADAQNVTLAQPGLLAAAGQPSLLVSITDANGIPITSVVPSDSVSVEYQVRVSYTCTGDSSCTNMVVSVTPPPKDPYYGTALKEVSSSVIPPFSPAPPITGNLETGWTVNLGTVESGATGTIVFRYFIKTRVGTPGSQVRNVIGWGNFFPPGFPIDPVVTVTADNATTVTGTDLATYDSVIPTPTMRFVAPASVKTDTPVTLTVDAWSGCWYENSYPTFRALYNTLCSDFASVAVPLPAKAVWVPGSGGTYDALTHTVTVTAGPDAHVGLRTGTFQVIFPSTGYPTSGAGCYATETFVGTGSVTYLDGTVKATDPASITRNTTVDNCTPFMKGTLGKAGTIASIKIPTTTPTTGHYWYVDTNHQGNKPGVITVVDDTLDQPGMPVYNMSTNAAATIKYTLDNGVSGEVTGTTYTAPAGQRIVKATVVSSPIAGPNLTPTGTANAVFRVAYRFAVQPGATPGNRINTASATITYPDFPAVPPFTPTGSPDSHTINLFDVTPFAKASVTKYSNAASYGIQATTYPGSNWVVDACNQANVDGVATITDTFNQAGLPVYHIRTNLAATINYTLDDGTTGTFVGTEFPAPAGRTIASATVVSPTLAGPNAAATGNACTLFRVTSFFYVQAGATPGDRTNSVTATMTYPNTDLGTIAATGSPDTHTINLFTNTPYTISAPVALTRTNVTNPTFEPRAGDEVRWTSNGQFCNLATDKTITPQYVFLAPAGWSILSNGASLANVPGATFDYTTVTYAGVAYNAVIVQWPAPVPGVGTGSGTNCVNLSQLAVRTTPTLSAVVGDQTAHFFVGDAANALAEAYTATKVLESTTGSDIDADGNTTDSFALRTGTSGLQGVAAVSVVKEICQPDPAEAGGCAWISDPGVTVGVPPTSTSIKYRVTIKNSGQTDLTNVVAYDVLPYPNDTGTSDSTAGTPRGSTVKEALASLSPDGATGMTIDYSTSTNPPRPEVYSGATTGNWAAPLSGASAIRATIPSLAASTSRTFTYEAALVGGAADQTACNSIALSAATIVPSEPPRVCASTQEADFEILPTDRLPLQADRVGVVPFTVTNKGGSAVAAGVVTLSLPAGLNVESLAVPGWSCTASSLTGPTEAVCRPVQADGTTTRQLARDVTETIPLRVRPITSATGTLCVDGEVESAKFDPVTENNTASSCALVVTGPELAVTKDDSKAAVSPGETYAYTITVANRLVAESVPNATLTDTLPAGLELVSTSPAATVAGPTLTWNLASLGQAGIASSSGEVATGGAGSTTAVTVTVRVLSSATGSIVNTASVSALDPAAPTTTLSAQGTDTDQLRRLTVAKSSDAGAVGVRAGDTVKYTVTLTNNGTADYTVANPAHLVDDLSGVLDDATFVAGSAAASINGGASTAVDDPSGGLLNWSGALAAGSVLTLSYEVTVGVGAAGDALTNIAYAASAPSSCTNGLTPTSQSCATVTTQFAPLLAKTVTSSVQNDDGTWTTVYSVIITNVSPTAAATYTLGDALAFGPGIGVVSAAVTAAPAGVTPAAWTGSGPIASDVSVPANTQHTYQLTVVATAGATGGTPAGTCTAGIAGGFANRASLTTADGRTATAEACAAPAEPTVDKTVTPATQLPDGRWGVEYAVTVTNSSPAELAYTLDDLLSIPAGVTVDEAVVTGPAGAPVNPTFNGAGDTALLSGPDRISAGSAATPTTRVFTIALVLDAEQAGAAGISALTCPPAGTGGYANRVSLRAGTSSTVLDSATACTNALPLPTPAISKRVTSTTVDADGMWTIVYDVAVTNTDATYSTRYSLDDDLQFAAGVSIDSAEVTSSDATVSPSWDGQSDTAVSTNVPLPAATTHNYTVTVTADPGAFDTESAAADCRLDGGETATGFSNLATATAGVKSVFSSACEPINDPSAVKTAVGAPVQDPETGVWALKYEITIKNRSTTTVGSVPYTLTDELAFPADVDVVSVAVDAPGGIIPNAGFDGVTDTTIATAGIGAAASDTDPAIQVYTVTVEFTLPAGLTDGAQCDPAQGPGGLFNEVELAVGARVSGSVACADVPEVPLAGVTKSVVSQEQQADGTWLLLYRVTVANPSTTAASEYSLDDEFAFGEGIELAAPATITAQPDGVATEPDWNGTDALTIAEDILLPAAGSHTYTVRAVIDSGAVTGDQPAGDCVLDPGESGTGFGNSAVVGSEVASASSEVCARAWDPGVTKEINGVPTQQADGSWLLSYTMTVTNPWLVPLSYGLVDELDFPAGTQITVESAAGREGSPTVQADWDGQGRTQLVADGTSLPSNAIHVFDVTVRALLPADQQSTADGWGNTATVQSGVDGVIATDAVAEADILVPELEVTKVATPSDPVLRIGDTVVYEVTMENVGEGDFTALFPAVVWDDLTDVLDDAQLTTGPSAAPDVATVAYTGLPEYRASAPLQAGDSVTIAYTVTIANGGNARLVNTAFAALPIDDDPATPSGDACEEPSCAVTRTQLPALHVTKSVGEGTIEQGGTVHYTVRVTNTGAVDIPADDPAVITDDLSKVLSNASYLGDAASDTGAVKVAGTTLTWVGGLTAGQTATITYAVRVAADAPDGTVLQNLVVSDPTLVALTFDGQPGSGQATTTTLITRLAITGGGLWSLGLVGALLLMVVGGLMWWRRPRGREQD